MFVEHQMNVSNKYLNYENVGQLVGKKTSILRSIPSNKEGRKWNVSFYFSYFIIHLPSISLVFIANNSQLFLSLFRSFVYLSNV